MWGEWDTYLWWLLILWGVLVVTFIAAIPVSLFLDWRKDRRDKSERVQR